jgi:GNAT superfamily N-acetyltransferase
MIDPVIRCAVVADLPQLQELELEARQGLTEVRGGLRWLEEHAAVDFEARISNGEVAIGHIDEVIVGYIVLGTSGRIALVEQVFVTEGARELGFGDHLIEYAIEFAKRSGLEYLEAEALPGDRNLKNLYERAGIVARSIIVSVRV